MRARSEAFSFFYFRPPRDSAVDNPRYVYALPGTFREKRRSASSYRGMIRLFSFSSHSFVSTPSSSTTSDSAQ